MSKLYARERVRDRMRLELGVSEAIWARWRMRARVIGVEGLDAVMWTIVGWRSRSTLEHRASNRAVELRVCGNT